MKATQLFFAAIAVIFSFSRSVAFAQSGQITIDLVTTFDYPGDGISTTATAINDHEDTVGTYIDSIGTQRGFLRHRNGNFARPIVASGDTGNYTTVAGINGGRTMTGTFLDASSVFHGFLLSAGAFRQFDAGSSTILGQITDSEDFVGTAANKRGVYKAFVNSNGSTKFIEIPGAIGSQAEGINSLLQVVGIYTDPAAHTSGFYRDENGVLTLQLEPPGAKSTNLQGINDKGWIVGRYTDANAQVHALLLKTSGRIFSYDFAGATETSFNGINNRNFIAGRYTDAAGVRHAFIAQINFNNN